MQEKSDYLMIQIEQLGRALGQILADLLGLKTQGRVSEANRIVHNALITELEIDIEELIKLSKAEFKSIISVRLHSNRRLYMQFADLLFETGIIQIEPENKLQFLQKALIMYNLESETDRIFSVSLQSKKELIQQIINDLSIEQ